MTDTLAPVERTNWALSAWNSTLDRNDVPSAWAYFFGLSSDLEFFLNKIFFSIIKINRLPSITMEAQAVARDLHLARWKRVSIRFEFLALIMVVMLLVGSRVYFR